MSASYRLEIVGIARRLACASSVLLVLLTMVASTGCSLFGGLSQSPSEKAQAEALERRSIVERVQEEGLEPIDLDERIEEGDRQLAEGSSQEALLTYLKAVRQEPSAPEPRERIGYVQLGHDPTRARAIFRDVLDTYPTRGSAQLGLGLSLIGEGRLGEAREAIQKAVEADPDSAPAHYALGVVSSLEMEHEEARAEIERALELDPDDAAMLNGLGVTHLMIDEFERAERIFRKAIRKAPMVSTYYNNLGIALGLQDRYEEALTSFRTVGNEQAARNNLGYVYYLVGRYDDALEEYELAMAESGDQQAAILRNINAAIDASEEAVVTSSPASRRNSGEEH